MALYVGILAGIAGVLLLTYSGWKAYARSQKTGGANKTKLELLEEELRRVDKANIVGAGPIPLTVTEQLKRLRALRERLHRRRDKAMSSDDV